MAEVVQKRLEDIRPVLEQMKKLELFSEHEIRLIVKKIKEHEYKLQRHTKSKEDYLKYIQYSMDLLKLVKLRREKYQITKKKSDIDFSIANKINHLFKEAILKFQDDLRFWLAYITFCKHVKFHDCINRMIARMLKVHHDKPKVWHIASRWEIEEKKNHDNARNFLLRGLQYHSDSPLLYTDLLKLELDLAQSKIEELNKKTESTGSFADNSENCYRKVVIIYEQAFKMVKSITFIVDVLNLVQDYKKTQNLQKKIIRDMLTEYTHEPLMWDTMARRKLKGLVQPSFDDDSSPMEVDNSEPASLRDRITNCWEVYQTAVKKVRTEEMWSLVVDCMLEINQEDGLPNYKRKLLRSALIQGHQDRKLKEKYYLNWIDMLNLNPLNKDSNAQQKSIEVLSWATEALPESKKLWYARLQYFLDSDQEELATEVFNEAIGILGKNSLSLWKLKFRHTQRKSQDKLEQFFKDVFKSDPVIINHFKPNYIEWIVLTQDIDAARKAYEKLCIYPPSCLELHKKMAELEILQPDISIKNARKPHEMATFQFGKENIDTWMNFVIFEMKYGDPFRIANVYGRAVNTLERTLVDDFIARFTLFKTQSSRSHDISM